MTFQSTVVKVAVFIFIVLMILIGLMMLKAKQNQTWPPEKSSCPDYWTYKENPTDSSKPGHCINDKFLGSCVNGQDDLYCKFPHQEEWRSKFNDSTGTKTGGTVGDNRKCCWAKYHSKVEWDGITNNRALCKGCDAINSELTG